MIGGLGMPELIILFGAGGIPGVFSFYRAKKKGRNPYVSFLITFSLAILVILIPFVLV